MKQMNVADYKPPSGWRVLEAGELVAIKHVMGFEHLIEAE